MKNHGKGETPQEHEARMQKWGEENTAALAAGKMKSHDEIRAIVGEMSCGKQVWLAAKIPKRFLYLWARLRNWRN